MADRARPPRWVIIGFVCYALIVAAIVLLPVS
jgi:hypothetical protein